MGYKLIQTDAFQRDLDTAVAYIALSLENKLAAAALLDAVQKCYDDLSRMPLMYEKCRDPHLRKSGYRKICINAYILIYRVNETSNAVYLVRFFHGKQNYEKLI